MSHTNQILFSFNNSRGNHFLCVSVAMILENMDNLNLAKFMLLIYHDNVLVPLVVTWQTITSYSWNKLTEELRRHGTVLAIELLKCSGLTF